VHVRTVCIGIGRMQRDDERWAACFHAKLFQRPRLLSTTTTTTTTTTRCPCPPPPPPPWRRKEELFWCQEWGKRWVGGGVTHFWGWWARGISVRFRRPSSAKKIHPATHTHTHHTHPHTHIHTHQKKSPPLSDTWQGQWNSPGTFEIQWEEGLLTQVKISPFGRRRRRRRRRRVLRGTSRH